MRFLIYLLLFFITSSYANIADNILNHYQTNLKQLSLARQEHFSLRLYRITGNSHFLPPIINFLRSLSEEYQEIPLILLSPNKIEEKTKALFELIYDSSVKRNNRIKKLSTYNDLYFYLYLLTITHQVHAYHLENTALFPKTDQMLSLIKKQRPRIENFILDKDNIKIYGAQLINYVYYLYDLNISDLREPYTKLFQKTFPDALDSKLSQLEYESKIYGMTHFITAASHYYQNLVELKDFEWIDQYFEKNIDIILRKSENDLITEVGVCLLLLNRQNSPTVKRIKLFIEKQYNPIYKMIPAQTTAISSPLNFAFGEHRNTLAIMLFKWPKKLTKGPFFNAKLQLVSH